MTDTNIITTRRKQLFAFEQLDGVPDRAWVDVDSKYSVTIIRTEDGIVIDVWPVGWDEPSNTMAVHDHDVMLDESEAV